jgi:hypothetical protein
VITIESCTINRLCDFGNSAFSALKFDQINQIIISDDLTPQNIANPSLRHPLNLQNTTTVPAPQLNQEELDELANVRGGQGGKSKAKSEIDESLSRAKSIHPNMRNPFPEKKVRRSILLSSRPN